MNYIRLAKTCAQNEYSKTKTFAPQQVGIPLLLNKMVKTNRLQLDAHINRSRRIYRKCEDRSVIPEKDALPAKITCPRPERELSRSLAAPRNWQLAPNRYNIKGRDVADIACKRTGTKGPFYSSTLRNDDSLYGHVKLSKPCGAQTFYDIPTMIDLLNRYYNKHKMKFSTASRYRKPYLRFMVTDIVLCWRNPADPGPAHYFPKNHCLENNVSKPVKAKPMLVVDFLPNSSVPARETDFLKVIDRSTPGPGRYETIEIACPCQNKLIIEPSIWREIEIEKRKRFRHLKFKRIKEELYCPCSKVRNIKGHGYTSLFNSKTVRLVQKMTVAKKTDRLEKMHHTAKYIQMIVNPPRIPISIARIDMSPKPAHLTFNSVIKPKMRCKLRVNKRIAFLSATPRFKDDDKLAAVAVDKKTPQDSRKARSSITANIKKPEPRLATLTPSKEQVFKRLQKLPSRFQQQQQVSTREKVFTFSPIPAPQLLLKDSDIVTRTPNAHYFKTFLNIEDYLKDEYRRPPDVQMASKESLLGGNQNNK